jgi:2-desacetyl-2-hydroxyethyl bacteriochlorophyllide A dehydrogenase
MQALIFRGERNVALESVADPRLEAPTDAVVRVDVAGVCGSDLHVYHGRENELEHGTVLGHEFVGEIVECGTDVAGPRPGDRVLSPFTTSCGRCYFCRDGLSARCEHGQLFGFVRNGHGLHGAQAEYVRVPLAESTLVTIPAGVSDEEALLLGDVASTGYYCARRADIRPQGVYVVLGCGPVGLMTVAGAFELGAETVFAVDAVPERLDLASRFGARAIRLDSDDLAEQLRDATDGRGADAVLEAVGSPEATRLAIDLVRPGGIVSVVGVHYEDRFPFSPVLAYDKNLTYRSGRCPARSLVHELIPLVRRKRFDLASVISHRLPLSRGAEAYEMFDRKADGCTKVVLLPGSSG